MGNRHSEVRQRRLLARRAERYNRGSLCMQMTGRGGQVRQVPDSNTERGANWRRLSVGESSGGTGEAS
jgi:hypothetical protein